MRLFPPVPRAMSIPMVLRWCRGGEWTAWVLAAALIGGANGSCARSVVVEQTSSVKLQRRKLEPEAPLLSSTWHVNSDGIEGHIDWQRCEREITWNTGRG